MQQTNFTQVEQATKTKTTRREMLSDLRALTEAAHAEGGAIFAQITHGGSP